MRQYTLLSRDIEQRKSHSYILLEFSCLNFYVFVVVNNRLRVALKCSACRYKHSLTVYFILDHLYLFSYHSRFA